MWELVEGCPDRAVLEVLEGYSERFVKDFSHNYLAPYLQARPVPIEKVEECRRFSECILGWAESVIIT